MFVRVANEWVEEIDPTYTKWVLRCDCFEIKVVLNQLSRRIHYKTYFVAGESALELCCSDSESVPGEYESDEEKDAVARCKANAIGNFVNTLKHSRELALAGMPKGYLYGERC